MLNDILSEKLRIQYKINQQQLNINNTKWIINKFTNKHLMIITSLFEFELILGQTIFSLSAMKVIAIQEINNRNLIVLKYDEM